jgi:hypothetical protein
MPLPRTWALPEDTQVSAPSQSVPGTRICWVVAPAARIAAIAAFDEASHCVGVTALGSFMSPNRTFDVEAKWAASSPQKCAKVALDAAVVPIIVPYAAVIVRVQDNIDAL